EDLMALMPTLAEDAMLYAGVIQELVDSGIRVQESVHTSSIATRDISVDVPEHLWSDSDTDSLKLYINEMRRYPLLSASEERKLTTLIQEGKEAAKDLDNVEYISPTRIAL